MQKKKFERFYDFLRPVFGHGRLGHPQFLEYYFLFFWEGGCGKNVGYKYSLSFFQQKVTVKFCLFDHYCYWKKLHYPPFPTYQE